MSDNFLYKTTIELTPITKKNSQQIYKNPKTGARWISQSNSYKKYASNAKWFLTGSPMINEPVNVQMLFYMPNRRKVDLSNLQSACLDILVDNQILADDNCKIVAAHDGSRVFYDKDNPRTEIEITKINAGE